MLRSCRFPVLALILILSAVTPALADSYPVYAEEGIPKGANIFTWCDAGQPCDVSAPQESANPEGSHNLRVRTNIWAGFSSTSIRSISRNRRTCPRTRAANCASS